MKKGFLTFLLIICLLCTLFIATACGIYTLEYKCEEGGTIQGKAMQLLLEGNNGQTVTAVPNEDYEFAGWSDGVETASRQDKSINDDLTVTALFKKLDKVPHVCESRCEVCDNCLNYDCLEPDCLNKCKCEPTHICVSKCIVCGGCLNHSCEDALCKIKCDCLTNPHQCNSKCETCGGCLNLDCVHKVCSNKCACGILPPTPVHTCESVCHMCGKCTNAECNDPACSDKCDNDPEAHAVFRFTLISNGTAYAVSANDRQRTVYEIPSTYNGLPVTEIAERGFANFSGYMVDVIIPNSVVKIGDYAFYNVRGITIYGMKNVTEIGVGAFADYFTNRIFVGDYGKLHICSNVCDTCGKCDDRYCKYTECNTKCACEKVQPNTVCESVCSVCGLCLNGDCGDIACRNKCENAVYTGLSFNWNSDYSGYEVRARYKYVTDVVNIPATWHGYPVLAISTNGFANCTNLTKVVIPSTIRFIGNSAFANCVNLETIVGMQGVEYIVSNAFYHCYKVKIFIQQPQHACESICPVCGGCKSVICVEEPCVNKCVCPAVPHHACQNACNVCGKCKDVNCCENACLSKCYGHVEQPSTFIFTLINDGTAYSVAVNHKGLEVYDIPATYNGLPVTEIAERGFTYCSYMSKVIIPDSVVKIGKFAFANSGKAEFYGLMGVKEIGGGAFAGQIMPICFTNDYENHICNSTCSSCGLCSDLYCLLDGCKDKCTEAVTEEETYYQNGIYYKLNRFGTGYSVNDVVDQFYPALTVVNIPAYVNGLPVVAIDTSAFYYCDNLVTVTIPDTVRYISNSAFYNCSSLNSIYINGNIGVMYATAFPYNNRTVIYINRDYHYCESICPDCGKCANANCLQTNCMLKCDCPVILPHVCVSFCLTCNGCTNEVCDDPACVDKCDCPHICKSVCSKCGKCLNENCHDAECAEKCDCKKLVVHICKSVCAICGGCQNFECRDEHCIVSRCYNAAHHPHECETVCATCNKCLNTSCTREACQDKCACDKSNVQTYTLTYIIGEGGRYPGTTVQTVNAGGNGRAVGAIADYGYQFWCWSDRPQQVGSQYYTRQDYNVQHDITVTAIFKRYSYSYGLYSGSGYVAHNGELYKPSFELFMNEDGTFDEVTAVPMEGFRFVSWEDGLQTPTRRETGLATSSRVIRAIFERIHTITYSVYNNFGGEIIGNLNQIVKFREDGEQVTAAAKAGFRFIGWSDKTTDNNHTATYLEKDLVLVAFFEAEQKTFTYNYNGANQPLQNSITLTRDNVSSVVFAVPQRAGYTFNGWYAESSFKTKVADENGKYYLGLIPFTMPETQLYAKWTKEGEQPVLPVYKVLLVVSDEFEATLWSSETQQYEYAYSKLTPVQRTTFKTVSNIFYDLLRDWLRGIATVEVDLYCLNEKLTMPSYDPANWNGNEVYYDDLFVKDVAEVADIYQKYNARMLFYANNLTEGDVNTVFNGHGYSLISESNYIGNIDHYVKHDYATLLFYVDSDVQTMLDFSPLLLDGMLRSFCEMVRDQAYYNVNTRYVSEFRDYYSYDYTVRHLNYVKGYLRGENLTRGSYTYKAVPNEFWREAYDKLNNK